MKNCKLFKQALFVLLFFGLHAMLYGQTELTLQPGAEGKDARVFSLPDHIDENYGDHEAFQATTWTYSSVPGTMRSFLEFDLSAIPAGASIVDARLSLYGHTGGAPDHYYFVNPNTFLIQRVTEAWEEDVVTWNNQPASVSTNEVKFLSTAFAGQDFIGIDVRNLLQDMLTEGNHGFVLRLETEEKYRSVVFCGGDHDDATKHPKLYIKYAMESEVVPADPGNLTASYTESTGVELQWDDNASDEARFVVERSSITNTNYQPVDTLAANTTTYVDNTATSPGKYFYRVKAESNSGFYGQYSNEVNVMVNAVIISNTNTSICNSYYYDDGFTEDIYNSRSYTHTLYPSENGKLLKMEFDIFDLPGGYTLNIYNGTSTAAELLGSFIGSALPPALYGANTSGALTIQQVGGSVTSLKDGWRAYVSCLDTLARPALDDIVVTSSSAQLTWTINEPTSTHTVIRRSKAGGAYVYIDTVYTSNSFTDTDLYSGTAYTYQVKTNASGYYSAWSLPFAVTTSGPAMPSELSVDTVAPSFITLSWLDNSDVETGFYISRSTDAYVDYQIIGEVMANETTYSDATAEAGILYFYKVAAFDASDTSAYSASVKALAGSVNMFTSASYNRCGYYLLDNGGLNNYTNGANITMTLAPAEAGKKMKLLFEEFNLEDGYDELIVSDGETVNHSFTGLSLPGELWSKSSTGNLDLTFTSDGSITKGGFKIFVKCIEIPDIPLNVSADTIERERIVINWQDGNGETGYVVQRAELTTDAFETIDTVGQDTTTFTDVDVQLGTTYFYRLYSVNPDARSEDFSDTVQADVPGPKTPYNLTVDTVGNTMATFSWLHNFNDETGFILERSANDTADFEPVAEVAIETLTFTEVDLAFDTILYYRIRSFDAVDTSGSSNIVMISPGAVTMFNSTGYARCGYILRDPGGKNDYGVNTNASMTLLPTTPGQEVQIVFNSFRTESNYDFLTVYDGDSLVAELSGVSTPDEIHATSASGELKLVFTSDYVINFDGFALLVNCIDVPTAPVALSTSGVTNKEVTLNWTDMSDNEEGFIVQRSVNDNSHYVHFDTLLANTTTFVDTTLGTGTIYFYRVVAWNTDGASNHTNEVQILTPGPATPQNLIATTTDTIVSLQWDDMSNNETGFIVERSVNDGQHFEVWKTTLADVTQVFDTIDGEREVFYRVRSTDDTYISDPSNTVSYFSYVILDNLQYTACGFYLTDHGGLNNYSHGEDYTMTLYSEDPSQLIHITFLMFDTESSYDYLKIYDGDLSTTNLIGSYSGNTLPPDAVATNDEGKLTLKFTSDGSNAEDGFFADVSCVSRPLAPANVSASSDAVDEAVVSWDLNTDSVTRYIIYLETEENGGFYPIDTVNYLVNEYTATGLSAERNYRFCLRAVRENVKSFMSDTVSVRIFGINSPANLFVESTSAQAITIAWDDFSNIEEGFIIYRADFGEDVFEAIDTVAANITSFADEQVVVKTKYRYCVTGYSQNFESSAPDTMAVWTNMLELSGYHMLNGVDNAVLVDNGGLDMFDSQYAHYLELFPETGKGFQYEFLSLDTKKDVDILQISYGMSNTSTYSGSDVPVGITTIPLNNALIFQWDPRTSQLHQGFEIFIRQDEVSNVSNPYARRDIQVYPNPFSHELFVHIAENDEQEAVIELSTVTGQLMYQQVVHLLPGQTEYPLTITNLDAGIYFCKVKHQHTETVFRICKE